jgi:hypothetical protein
LAQWGALLPRQPVVSGQIQCASRAGRKINYFDRDASATQNGQRQR